MSLEMSTRNVAGGSVQVCSGRIVPGDESARLRQVVKEALGECSHIVLELGKVGHIDSTGLGMLAGLHCLRPQNGSGDETGQPESSAAGSARHHQAANNF
ncbi:MAG TPA: STAS domain-containing protein [Terriglobales bacterium]|nr:STAS domain-containing protein [Terriglobales bacterium]